jgi:outer membrane protein OmpA-like peptidoglycan-associated protein
MNEVGCYTDSRGYHIAETFASLTAGQTYYIRVDGKYNKTGTFQLCVNNYNAVPDPNGDCSDAVVLCDNSSFTVPTVVGYGKYQDPLGTTCLRGGESSSVWYKWTCDEPGTLTFKLTPVNPSDDIDFALFLLPNGIEDCSLKIPLRCMASGEQGGQPLMTWISCTGATGLRESSSDYIEREGCDPGDDNFLSSVRMEKGQSFALLINNFHNTGNGFSIDFGGTGKPAGPKPYFKVSKLKLPVDSLLTIWNVSKFDGGKITKYEWDFGVDATPKTYRGWKPPKVRYKSPGKKSISLTVETDRGCTVTKIRNLTIIKNPPKPPKTKEQPQVVAAKLKEEKTPPKVNKNPSEETDFQANTGKEIINSKPKPIVDLSETKKAPKAPKKDTAIVYYDVLHVCKLYFDADSFNLKTDHLPFVNEAIHRLNKNPKNMLHVEGHTNGIPRDEYCNKLAQKRAQSALDYLKRKGVPEKKVVEKIYGKTKPQAPNKSLVGRKRNQRVEIKVLRPEE